MLLTIQERLMLGNSVLPSKGDFVTLGIVDDFKRGLSLTEEEIVEFEIVQNETGVTWNVDKAKDIELEIGESIRKLIIETLKKLDEDKELTPEYMSLYRKFMLTGGPPAPD